MVVIQAVAAQVKDRDVNDRLVLLSRIVSCILAQASDNTDRRTLHAIFPLLESRDNSLLLKRGFIRRLKRERSRMKSPEKAIGDDYTPRDGSRKPNSDGRRTLFTEGAVRERKPLLIQQSQEQFTESTPRRSILDTPFYIVFINLIILKNWHIDTNFIDFVGITFSAIRKSPP